MYSGVSAGLPILQSPSLLLSSPQLPCSLPQPFPPLCPLANLSVPGQVAPLAIKEKRMEEIFPQVLLSCSPLHQPMGWKCLVMSSERNMSTGWTGKRGIFNSCMGTSSLLSSLPTNRMRMFSTEPFQDMEPISCLNR